MLIRLHKDADTEMPKLLVSNFIRNESNVKKSIFHFKFINVNFIVDYFFLPSFSCQLVKVYYDVGYFNIGFVRVKFQFQIALKYGLWNLCLNNQHHTIGYTIHREMIKLFYYK